MNMPKVKLGLTSKYEQATKEIEKKVFGSMDANRYSRKYIYEKLGIHRNTFNGYYNNIDQMRLGDFRRMLKILNLELKIIDKEVQQP